MSRLARLLGLLVLLAVFASAFVGIRYAVRAYPPGALALLRFGVASLALAVALALRRGRLPLPAGRDVPGLALAGLFGITLYHLALNAGERSVSAGAASLLVNTTPIFTALLAVAALRERPGARAFAGTAIGFAGVALVSLGESGGLALDGGALLVLGAAIAASLYYVIEKRYLHRYPALEVTAWGFWAGTALLAPFGPQLAGSLREAPLPATLSVLYLGLFPAAIGYVGWSVVLSRMEVSRAATLLYLIPPLAGLLGWALLGEVPGGWTALGGAVTIAGVALVNARRSRGAARVRRDCPDTTGVAEKGSPRRESPDRPSRPGRLRWRGSPSSPIPGGRHEPSPQLAALAPPVALRRSRDLPPGGAVAVRARFGQPAAPAPADRGGDGP